MNNMTCDIKSNVKFKVGDIIRYKNNPNVKYIVTAISTLSGKPTWIGLSTEGRTNGGTVEGSWNFDDYELIGRYPIYNMYTHMKDCGGKSGKKK